MSSHRSWFHSYTPLTSPIDIVLSNDSSILATSVGRISIHMHANGKTHPTVLQDILYVPELHRKLLSISQLTCRGTEVHFVTNQCHIWTSARNWCCKGNLHSNLYVMDMTVTLVDLAHIVTVDTFPAEGDDPPETALITEHSSLKASIDTWHRRLGHLNTDAILHMVCKGMVKGWRLQGATLLPAFARTLLPSVKKNLSYSYLFPSYPQNKRNKM